MFFSTAAQVQAFIRGNSVQNKINSALEIDGTPNLLIQVNKPFLSSALW